MRVETLTPEAATAAAVATTVMVAASRIEAESVRHSFVFFSPERSLLLAAAAAASGVLVVVDTLAALVRASVVLFQFVLHCAHRSLVLVATHWIQMFVPVA